MSIYGRHLSQTAVRVSIGSTGLIATLLLTLLIRL